MPEITSEITCRELHLSRCSDHVFFNPSGGILHQLGSLTQRLIHEGKEYTHDSIPEAWASYFATPVATPFSEEQLKILAAYHRSQSLPAIEPDLVSQEEVVVYTHSLPLRKAAGPDHITNEHLKFVALGYLQCHSSGHIPASFRHGLIFPIPKGNNKDLQIPTNYRGIIISIICHWQGF